MILPELKTPYVADRNDFGLSGEKPHPGAGKSSAPIG
jgi:hypothetical protein